MKMKQKISIFIAMMCVVTLGLGLVACNGGQAGSRSGEVLSDVELDSLMFSLDDAVYTLPVRFSELEENGWRPHDTDPPSGSADSFETDTLEPGGFAHWELIIGNQNVLVTISNLTEEVLPVSESHVTDVALILGVNNARFILPRGIMMGSTHEEVVAAYGEPDVEHINDGAPSFMIQYSSDDFILDIAIDSESNLVNLISLSYMGG